MMQSLIGAAALAALAAAASPPAVPPSRALLEQAFAFASALETDPKDRSMAQAAVALEALGLDDAEQAAALADRVQGWQRGAVYAEIAAWHARAGERERARAFLARAQDLAASQEGWQGPRIRAHVGFALAALGEAEAARDLTAELAANDRQYQGVAVVAGARARLAAGGFDAALAEVRRTEGQTDHELALGRASACLELARHPGATPEQRKTALRGARAAAEQVPAWTRIDLLSAIAEELWSLEAEEAEATLAAAEDLGRALPGTSVVRAGALSAVAEAWIALSREERARATLDAAWARLPEMQAIDRPEMRARIAAGSALLPDAVLARERFGYAVAEAEALVNARPRALAAAAICRAMARAGWEPDPAMAERLQDLREGLKGPW